MIIAVNTRLQKNQQPDGYESFLFETLDGLTKKFPQQQFLYIFDKPYDQNLVFEKNVLPIVSGPETSNSLRLQYWFNFKIPAVLRKYKADVFVSLEGICSQRTQKPQCLLITNLDFLQPATGIKRPNTRFYKKFTPSFLAKAKSIAVVSSYAQSVITSHYKINAADVDIINPGISKLFKPVGWEEKESIKEEYAEGKAYFLYSGKINPEANLINLLKAFSLFKKRQKSNMLLLIAGNADEKFKKELNSYKWRMDVKLLENLPVSETAKITAAAYALVYPVHYADLPLSPLQALQCAVPVVVSHVGALPSVLEKAALYFEPDNVANMADNLMLIFKDEDKAKELITAGNALLKKHQLEKTAALLMQSIEKAFNN